MADSGVIKLDEGLIQRITESGFPKTGIRDKLKKPVDSSIGNQSFAASPIYLARGAGGTIKLTADRGIKNSIVYPVSPGAIPIAKAGAFVRAASQSTDAGKWNTSKRVLNALYSGGDIERIINILIKEGLETVAHSEAGTVAGQKTGTESEDEVAKKAAESTIDAYLPPAGGNLPNGFDPAQKTVVANFLKDTYKIFNLYKSIWGGLGQALMYGQLEENSAAAYIEEVYGVGGTFEGLVTGARSKDFIVDDIESKINFVLDRKNVILVGPLGFARPVDTSVDFDSLIDYSSASFTSGLTDAKGQQIYSFGTNVGVTSANKAVEQIKNMELYQNYFELLKLYAEVVATLDGLRDDGELDYDEQLAISEAQNATNLNDLKDIIEAATAAAGGSAPIRPRTPPAGKESATELQKQSAANIRTSIRDYLTINTPLFAAIKEKRREIAYDEHASSETDVEQTFRGVYPIEGKPECGVSQLLYNENQQKLLDLTPAEVSSLVPMVRLFKIGNDFEQEIPFESNAINNIENDKSREINSGNFIENYNRGNSVGIRSLEWSYQGTNPANDTKDISLTLTLFFQSFSDILRNRHIGIPGPEFSAGKNKPGVNTFSYADLITRPRRLASSTDPSISQSEYDPEYYRIKFLIGYAYSDPINGAGDIIPNNKRLAIDTTVLPIIATLIDHRFDIQEDGSVNLVITYRGYLEAVAHSEGANIFSSPELEITYHKARNVLKTVLANCESGQTAENLRKNLTSELDWFGKEIQQLVFSKILTELRAENKIYTTYPRVEDLISRKIVTTDLDLYPPSEPNTYSVISEIIDNARKAASKCEHADKEKCVEDIFSRNVTPQSIISEGKRVVTFFYVSDLIKIVKGLVNENYSKNQEKKGTGTAAQTAFKNTRIVLTDIRMTQNPEDPVYDLIVNMGDIPISVETFSIWFVKHITKYQGNKKFPEYSFGLFLRDLLSTTLSKFKNYTDESGTSHTLTDTTSIQRAQVYAPVDAIGECAQKNKKLNYNLFIPGAECKSITRITQNSKHGPGESEETMQFYSKQAAENWFNYFIFYPRTAALKSDPCENFPKPTKENLDKGFYQFNFGVNSGMVQKVSFEKDDQPYVREARFFAAETNYKKNKLLQLREPYKITIETFGLPSIFPGSICFVDSRCIDLALGNISDRTSLSYMLGFGGYHLITHAKNTIGPGEFRTTLTAKWTSHGTIDTLNDALARKPANAPTTPADNCNLRSKEDNSSKDAIQKAFEDLGFEGQVFGAGTTGLDPNRARLGEEYPEIPVSEAFANILHDKVKDFGSK
tara:strand:- start:12271 stop:16161 length:3891 start_codon:yes stop_codon:yes gene_type:complete